MMRLVWRWRGRSKSGWQGDAGEGELPGGRSLSPFGSCSGSLGVDAPRQPFTWSLKDRDGVRVGQSRIWILFLCGVQYFEPSPPSFSVSKPVRLEGHSGRGALGSRGARVPGHSGPNPLRSEAAQAGHPRGCLHLDYCSIRWAGLAWRIPLPRSGGPYGKPFPSRRRMPRRASRG